jgi:hypothetical protein
VFASSTGECCGDRAEQGAVVGGNSCPFDLAMEHLDPVAQHDDLQVLRAPRTHCESSERIQQDPSQPREIGSTKVSPVGEALGSGSEVEDFRVVRGPSDGPAERELVAVRQRPGERLTGRPPDTSID